MNSRPLLALPLAAFLAFTAADMSAAPLSTAFTYQGRLDNNSAPASGAYDLQFELYDDANAGTRLAGPVLNSSVTVASGLFSTSIDFGAVFRGTESFLQISVRATGSSQFVPLTPRQRLSATPNALYAAAAATVVENGVTGQSLQNATITSPKIAGNQVVKSLNGLKDDITLMAGNGISITPSPFGNGLSIAATGGGANPWTPNAAGINYSTGKVGVGTTSPLSPLDVVGNWDGEHGALELHGNRPTLRLTGDAGSGNQSWLMHLGGNGPGNLEFYHRTGPGAWANHLTLSPSGFVGINTTSPTFPLDVNGDIRSSSDLIVAKNLRLLNAPTEAELGELRVGNISRTIGPSVFTLPPRMLVAQNGNVGIGTANPEQKLHVAGTFLLVDGQGQEKAYIGGDGVGGEVHVGSYNPDVTTVALYNQPAGKYMHLNLKSCTIFGGADLAEPFQMSDSNIPKGAVVVIDPENSGRLKMSRHAYDKRVAGIVSGANGVNPGIALQQQGVLEGGQNVALSGRVYVQTDASEFAIEPGDLLTTSDTPGHAMKVDDHHEAQGAILGKAMSSLAKGTRGMVLVLVTLQ